MKGFRLLAACVGLAAAQGAAGATVTVQYSEPLERLALTGGAATGLAKPGDGTPARLTFDAFGQTFDLELEPNARLLSDAARAALPAGVRAYRGGLAGKPGSWSRIVIADGVPRGLVRDGAELYAIEASAAGEPFIYRLEDLYVPPGSVSCASEAADGAALFGGVVGDLGETMSKAGANSQIGIGAIGDYEMFEREGHVSEVAILTRLNNVDGIFSEQLGVQIVVDDVLIFAGPSDPFSDTASPRALLDELAAYRRNDALQRGEALTHLFTGRKLEGTTVGIAFNGTLCDAEWGAGLTRLGGNVTFDSLVAAHEIGHNFGAPHDGEAGSACAAQTGTFLMSPTITGTDQFSSCSLSQMRPKVSGAFCVAPVPTVDAVIGLRDALAEAAPGTRVTARFDVGNGGTALATGVSVDITLPANASFSSASSSQGACTDGAGMVSCAIGDVPAGSNRIVTIEMVAEEVGAADLVATVSAAADTDPANDSLVTEFRVKPDAQAGGGTPAPTAGP
ncbi:MAG TPA: zinc-dependent metalloprotease family protein, partial [Woeseiaceae bacterium]